MKVYAVQHCPCTYESGFETVSLHSTKVGAAKAMNQYKSGRHEQETLGAEVHDDALYLVSIRMDPGSSYSTDAYRYAVLEVAA